MTEILKFGRLNVEVGFYETNKGTGETQQVLIETFTEGDRRAISKGLDEADSGEVLLFETPKYKRVAQFRLVTENQEEYA